MELLDDARRKTGYLWEWREEGTLWEDYGKGSMFVEKGEGRVWRDDMSNQWQRWEWVRGYGYYMMWNTVWATRGLRESSNKHVPYYKVSYQFRSLVRYTVACVWLHMIWNFHSINSHFISLCHIILKPICLMKSYHHNINVINMRQILLFILT